MAPLRPNIAFLRRLQPIQARCFSAPSSQTSSTPRHLLSIANLSPAELTALVRNAASHKAAVKAGSTPKNLQGSLAGKLIAMPFSKRSTRTRVSTEGAIAILGGNPMFLGKEDIQLGVNESLRDTSIIISSMTAGIVARVGPHSDIKGLAEYSSVPVINALCDSFHPLQSIADFLTISECHPSSDSNSLGLNGLKIAWVGNANNVLFDMAIASAKLGVHIAVATPEGYAIPNEMRKLIQSAASDSQTPGKLSETNQPLEAVKDADIIVTDTWISMGQEAEKVARLKAFEGYQITNDMAAKGGAKESWKFMHCLPRHPEEVSDEVFYGPRSVVFQEGENRLWAAVSALEGFVVNKGKIL